MAIESKTNIVAEGLVFRRNGSDEKIHNIPLGENSVCMSIENVLSPNDILSISVPGQMETIKDALGSLIAWPKEFVLLCAEVN